MAENNNGPFFYAGQHDPPANGYANPGGIGDKIDDASDTSNTPKPKKNVKQVVFNALTGPNLIYGTILCLYVGYSDTQHLCVNKLTYTKSNNAIFQNQPILDPDSLLGPSGHIITWFRICGITRAVLIGLKSFSVKYPNILTFFSSLHVLFLFGMSIYGLQLIFGEKMPQECVDYHMGNNFAYIALYFMCIVDLIIYTLLGLIVAGIACAFTISMCIYN